MRRFCNVNIEICYVCLGNNTYTSEQYRRMRQKTYIGVKMCMYPHENRSFTSMKCPCVYVLAMLLSLEPTQAHLSEGSRTSSTQVT